MALLVVACGQTPIQPTPDASDAGATPAPTAVPTPDLQAPSVLAQDPPPGATVATNGSVRVTFSEPVSGVDAGRFQLRAADGATIASTVTVDAGRRFASLVPLSALHVAATYTATLAGSVRDDAGNLLAPISWSVTAADEVSFAAGTFTGYRFGDSSAHVTAIKRATLGAASGAQASEYREVDGLGYLVIATGIWAGYLVHGQPGGVAIDDQAAPISQLPACDYVDLPTARPSTDDWASTLLDTVFMLPAGYVPPELVSTATVGLNGGYFIRAIAADDLAAMVDAAAAAGVHLAVQSAYRSYRGQVLTFNGWVSQVGHAQALLTSARPGHSEHQLGTAIDFRTTSGPAPWSLADWATTTEGAWMAANAWRFGWVMSYPRDSLAVTCYRYEPWHYRYVGRDTAAVLHAGDDTLREWLWNEGYGIR